MYCRSVCVYVYMLGNEGSHKWRRTEGVLRYYYSDGPAGCVYMMYADESHEVKPTESGSRLLTSSTTKLSSLLSASLP